MVGGGGAKLRSVKESAGHGGARRVSRFAAAFAPMNTFE